MESDAPIILFDGNCVVCSRSVRFVFRHDPAGLFRFAAQYTPEGRALIARPNLPNEIIVKLPDRELGGADAVLYIAAQLGWPWKLALIFKLVPKPLRDAAYRFTARHRYQLFAGKDACEFPDPALRARFVTPGDLPATPPPPAAQTPAA